MQNFASPGMSINLKQMLKSCLPPVLLDLYRRLKGYRITSDTQPRRGPRVEFTLPKKEIGDLFPGIEKVDIRVNLEYIQNQRDEWSLPLRELFILGAICSQVQPSKIFEIGTYRGQTTRVMAENTPEDTEIFTLDLAPSQRQNHKHGLGIGGFPSFAVGECFLNTGSSPKIRQLYDNSVLFDYAPFHRTMDIVFIDADHTYDYVKTDSENALKLIAEGGIVIWDDYLWDMKHPECAGVTRYLNELSVQRQIYSVLGTRLAIYIDSFQPVNGSHEHPCH